MTAREKLKAELQGIILQYLREQRIDPKDSTTVIMNAPGIWKALCVSGKMPKVLTYDAMMSGMISGAMSNQFENIFGA